MPDCIGERADALKSNIYSQAEKHSRRLGKISTDAGDVLWRHNDAMRAVYHARSLSELDRALVRLSELNASY